MVDRLLRLRAAAAGVAVMMPLLAVAGLFPSVALSQVAAQSSTGEIVGARDKLEALELIRDSIAANLAQIKSLRATYGLQERIRIDNAARLQRYGLHPPAVSVPVVEENEVRVFFVWQAATRSLYTEYEVIRSNIREEGGATVPVRPNDFYQRSIAVNDGYLHFQPNVTYGELIDGPTKPLEKVGKSVGQFPQGGIPTAGRVAFRDHLVERQKEELGTVVGPTELFGYGGERMDHFLSRIIGYLSESDGESAISADKVLLSKIPSDSGASVVYWLRLTLTNGGGARPMELQYWFDGDAGFNVKRVRAYVGDDRSRFLHDYDWAYKQHGDVFLPERLSHLIPTSDGKLIRHQRLLFLKEFALNPPVQPEQFTFRALGLQNGDRFVDRMNDQMFVYVDGELVDADDYHRANVVYGPQTRTKTWSVWVLTVGLAIVVLVAWMILRYYRSHRRRPGNAESIVPTPGR